MLANPFDASAIDPQIRIALPGSGFNMDAFLYVVKEKFQIIDEVQNSWNGLGVDALRIDVHYFYAVEFNQNF